MPGDDGGAAEMDEIEISDVPDDAAVSELRQRLVDFNIATTGYENYRSMSCFLRDADGELQAGIDGFTWGGYAMVEWLWVAPSRRGDGLGSRLMRALESEARARGCAVIRVNTHTFQAPDFYRGLGYEELGYAEDTPVGHGEFFFAKRLA
jgi:ribosomal protein S18 acetylase RimI-like enzyme